MSQQVADRLIAAVSSGDSRRMGPVYALNAVQIDKAGGEVMHGRNQIQTGWNNLVAAVPGFHWRGTVVSATPDHAVVSWVFSGQDNPYTHKPFVTPGVSILDIENGAISRETLYYNIPR